MRITHLAASNWRNFKYVEFDVGERLFVVGPNAAGKSNLLDVFRFLADIVGLGGADSPPRSSAEAGWGRSAACSPGPMRKAALSLT